MKKTIGIKRNFIIIIISILLSACTKKENASQQALLLELVQAEAVMYEHPDSALGVLQGMKVPAVSDKLQNATWALLTVQAKYKNYKEELADSTLINIAYDYFMKQNNPQRKAMYNPQNEMFRLLGTKRSFSQNETFFFSHPYPPYPALFRLISHF